MHLIHCRKYASPVSACPRRLRERASQLFLQDVRGVVLQLDRGQLAVPRLAILGDEDAITYLAAFIDASIRGAAAVVDDPVSAGRVAQDARTIRRDDRLGRPAAFLLSAGGSLSAEQIDDGSEALDVGGSVSQGICRRTAISAISRA